MDYTRTYWLLFAGSGGLFAALAGLDAAEAGGLSIGAGLSLAVGLLVLGVSSYAARYPDRAGGPAGPTLRFGIAVLAFVVMAGLVIRRLLGL